MQRYIHFRRFVNKWNLLPVQLVPKVKTVTRRTPPALAVFKFNVGGAARGEPELAWMGGILQSMRQYSILFILFFGMMYSQIFLAQYERIQVRQNWELRMLKGYFSETLYIKALKKGEVGGEGGVENPPLFHGNLPT